MSHTHARITPILTLNSIFTSADDRLSSAHLHQTELRCPQLHHAIPSPPASHAAVLRMHSILYRLVCPTFCSSPPPVPRPALAAVSQCLHRCAPLSSRTHRWQGEFGRPTQHRHTCGGCFPFLMASANSASCKPDTRQHHFAAHTTVHFQRPLAATRTANRELRHA